MFKSLLSVIPFVLICLSVVSAGATIPAIWVQYITPNAPAEVSLLVLPDGSGPPLTAASLFGGQVVDASFDFRIVDDGAVAVPHYPGLDLWIETSAGDMVPCRLPLMADSDTDLNGESSFSGAFAAGGWSEGPVLMYQHGWEAHASLSLQHPPLPLRFNSPDLNADKLVNLSDVPLFAADYLGAYSYRSDFVWDGVINLSDLVKMAQGLGHDCASAGD